MALVAALAMILPCALYAGEDVPLLTPKELATPASGSYRTGGAEPTGRLRVTNWNIEYGREYERISTGLRQRYKADIYLLQAGITGLHVHEFLGNQIRGAAEPGARLDAVFHSRQVGGPGFGGTLGQG